MQASHRLIVVLAAAWAACSAPSQAHQVTHGDLTLAHPFLRLDPTCGAGAIPAYVMLIINAGAQPDRLVGAELDQAGKGRLMRVSHAAGSVTPELLATGIEIPAKGQIALMPPDLVIEFPKSRQTLMEGGAAKGTLDFQRAGKVAVTFMVDAAHDGQVSTGCAKDAAASAKH